MLWLHLQQPLYLAGSVCENTGKLSGLTSWLLAFSHKLRKATEASFLQIEAQSNTKCKRSGTSKLRVLASLPLAGREEQQCPCAERMTTTELGQRNCSCLEAQDAIAMCVPGCARDWHLYCFSSGHPAECLIPFCFSIACRQWNSLVVSSYLTPQHLSPILYSFPQLAVYQLSSFTCAGTLCQEGKVAPEK